VWVDSAKHIAKSKGVHREVESEGSWRQNSGLTNRNHIRGRCTLGEVAQQTKALNYPKVYDVYVADRWSERLRSYLGRSDIPLLEGWTS